MKDILIIILVILIYFSPVFYQLFIVIKENKKGNKVPLGKLKRILKISLMIIVPLLIAFALLIRVNYLNYERPMTFDKYDQITFENFRGLEFFRKSLYGNERFAYVVTTIETDISNDGVTIESLFHPSRSFVYKRNIFSEDLLSHEKYHIKITELFTRKAKKKIAKLDRYDKERIEMIIDDMYADVHDYQKEYDYNTFHSYVWSEQKRYEKEIDSLLNLLAEYKKPKIQFNEKN
ncbi:hypothetical protein [Robertkochia solimangrovi]|uniref:hypothetical protein n=1 Tax=Robertkochia solimangrovi TaxID=2213046 RepID=UPI001180B6A3|nr:hypothetical protein [Robertkochia solimangrovi]TRZ43991.1 hypothetical protein DMZ48_08550 [Robertkochia solimangrovi]